MPRIEDGIVVGTGSNKYQMKNPIGRWLISRFDRTVANLARQVAPQRVLEVGAGEGHLTRILAEVTGASIMATDISDTVLDEVRSNLHPEQVSCERLSIYDLEAERHRADLVVCCEVLEHIDDPERGLRALARVAAPYLIVSVPREPIFRGLNLLRGAHLGTLGNSPGHVQHWSRRAFKRLVARDLEVLEVHTPLPWTVILARA